MLEMRDNAKPRLQAHLRHTKIATRAIQRMHQPVKRDKTYRARDSRIVEASWDCKLTKSLPAELTPRRAGKNGKRVGYDEYDRKRLHSSEWTKAFFHALATLSKSHP